MLLRTPEGQAPETRPSRRMALSLFTGGYALALSPPALSAITTDASGLVIEEPRYRAAGGYRLPAYVARPEGRGRRPAVIVVNEIFGIHAYIKDVCRRLAKSGYVAIAPDFFDRAGDPSALSDFAAIGKIVDATPAPQVMEDLEATVRHLKRRAHVADDKIAVTGFCWGGTFVWKAVAEVPGIRAGAAWYGRVVKPAQNAFGAATVTQWPVDLAAELKAPVLGLYAENDQAIPLEGVEALRRALAAAGNPTGSEIIVYPGTEHGFHADYRPSYNEAAAIDAWSRMLAWFAEAGVA